jgi:hypothetical protein
MNPAETQIESLHARVQGLSPPLERSGMASRLAGMFRRADLIPLGLPPAAILIVRRIPAERLPRLALWESAAALSLDWEQAAREALAEALRHAARPQRGEIPFDAQAALFADEADWLACLLLDWSRGRRQRRWWWPRQLPWLPEWLGRQARALPAALELLWEWGAAQAAVETLNEAEAQRVLQALFQTHGLPGGAAVHAEASQGREPAPLPGGGEAGEARRDGRVASDAAVSPWRRWGLPDFSARRLGWPRAALLGVSLALRRRPALAQEADFWRDYSYWQAAWRAALPSPVGRDALSLPGEPPARATSAWPEEALSQASRLPAEGTVQGLTAAGGRAAQEAEKAVTALHLPLPAAAAPGAQQETAGIAPSPSPARAAGEQAATQLGGVFYLIGLLTALDLPDCCQAGWRLASELSAWGLLETVARGLLDGGMEFERDALWAALAALDGRGEDEMPGAGVTDGGDFRPPTSWLLPDDLFLPEAEFRSPWIAALNPALRGWLSQALPYLRRRLLAALRGVAEGELAERLLLRRARLEVQPLYLDIVMSLEDICLPARSAGLDRDPGWQPAYGRVIRFHYL